MKRILALVMIFVLLPALVSCEDKEASSDSWHTHGVGTATETVAEEALPDVFEEKLVVDNDECRIKVTGFGYDKIWGYTLNVQLENKSSDTTYMFSLDDASVNGIMTTPLFASEVAPGKKANEDINFLDDNFEKNGITRFTDIELTFKVSDSKDWSADNVAHETVHIYPYGNAEATVYKREAQEGDLVIVDNEYAKVTVIGYETDEIWGYTVRLYVENKSEYKLMFSANEVSVNGFMVDPYYAKAVSPGKCAFDSMSWSESSFETNGITDVEEIELNLSVSDANDWFAEDFINETITLKP